MAFWDIDLVVWRDECGDYNAQAIGNGKRVTKVDRIDPSEAAVKAIRELELIDPAVAGGTG